MKAIGQGFTDIMLRQRGIDSISRRTGPPLQQPVQKSARSTELNSASLPYRRTIASASS
jgi:hypothetical protein